jgi:hypothetical protein
MNYKLVVKPNKGEPKEIEIVHRDEAIVVPLVPLPEAFREWQRRFRIANIRYFMTREGGHDFAVHVGYMATLNPTGPSPINIAAKGIGLLPRYGINELVPEIEELIAEGLQKGEEETRERRLRFLLKLYEEWEFDPFSFTTIEIYAKTTWRNIQSDPRCSVLFSSDRNVSFLINGVAEVLGPETLEYRFVTGLHDLFHLPRGGVRRNYPAIYRVWATEAYNKTPGPKAGEKIA